MTFTIEPMIAVGAWQHRMWDDDWTAVTIDGQRTAQFEHTLLVTDDGVEILTLHPDGRWSGDGASPATALGVETAALGSAPMTNRTFVMCKPDAVERGLVGEIVARLERKGLTPGGRRAAHGRRRRWPRPTTTSTASKPFFGELVAFLTRSPVFAMIVEGPDDNTWELVPHPDRQDPGRRRPARLDPGRLRHHHHREPGPRLRRPRVGRARDRALVPRAPDA